MWAAFLLTALQTLQGCAENAFAEPPFNVTDWAQYARVGGSSGWSSAWTTPTASGTAGLVRQDPSDAAYTTIADLHLFQWGTSIRVSCDATTNAVMAWVQDADDITIAMTGYITDADTLAIAGTPAAPDGANGAFRVEAGTYLEDVPWRSTFRATSNTGGSARRAPGARYGYCPETSTTPYWPCDDNDDCGSGTCQLTCSPAPCDPQARQLGAFLQTLSTGSAANCFLSELR